MSKARDPAANWYRLPFGERRELMHGHGKVGRRYTGRVLQLVTGSTGLDDFEWGVTLLADDLSAIKEVVYDMRFDEVTASYGRFGPFLVGLTCDPADPGAPGAALTGGWSRGHQRVVRPPILVVASSEPWRGQTPRARALAKGLRPVPPALRAPRMAARTARRRRASSSGSRSTPRRRGSIPARHRASSASRLPTPANACWLSRRALTGARLRPTRSRKRSSVTSRASGPSRPRAGSR